MIYIDKTGREVSGPRRRLLKSQYTMKRIDNRANNSNKTNKNKRNNKRVKYRVKNNVSTPKRRYRQVNKAGLNRRNLPIAKDITVRSLPAKFVNRGDMIKVTHREFVLPVSVPTTSEFYLWMFQPINPGSVQMFPWLSAIAKNYETYVVEDFAVHYVPTCPTTTPGQVMMSIDYDADDDAPGSQIQMLNMKNAISFNPYSEKTLKSTYEELNKGMKSKYVHDFSQGATAEDPKTLNLGNLIIAVVGTSGGTVGNLYIEYTIKLKTPAVKNSNTTQGPVTLSNISRPLSSSLQPPFRADSFGDLTYAGNLYLASYDFHTNATYDTIYFDEGYYMINWDLQCSTTLPSTNTGTTNIAAYNVLFSVTNSASPFKNHHKAIVRATLVKNRLDFQVNNNNDTMLKNFFRITPLSALEYSHMLLYFTYGYFFEKFPANLGASNDVRCNRFKMYSDDTNRLLSEDWVNDDNNDDDETEINTVRNVTNNDDVSCVQPPLYKLNTQPIVANKIFINKK